MKEKKHYSRMRTLGELLVQMGTKLMSSQYTTPDEVLKDLDHLKEVIGGPITLIRFGCYKEREKNLASVRESSEAKIRELAIPSKSKKQLVARKR